MSANPGLIGYERGATDTDLMRLKPGWIAKGGAEGLICVATSDGVGKSAGLMTSTARLP